MAANRFQGFQDGGMIPGNMNQPRLVMAHGGERITNEFESRRGTPSMINIELTLDGEVLARQFVNLKDDNVSGLKSSLQKPKTNIKNFQEVGA